jgi:hypothetical protein
LSGRLDARIRALLDANPDLALHEMLDPNQDRLMARCMGYFRLKRLRLGESFERFLEENLAQNATIILAECNLGWPTTRVGERYVFQFGGLGGATLEELFCGGERVEEYLKRYRTDLRHWEPPEPDVRSPEAFRTGRRALPGRHAVLRRYPSGAVLPRSRIGGRHPDRSLALYLEAGEEAGRVRRCG